MKLMTWGIIIFPQVDIKHQTPNLIFLEPMNKLFCLFLCWEESQDLVIKVKF